MENLENLSRKELQALAKANGVKANLATAELIAKLKSICTSGASDVIAQPEPLTTLDAPIIEQNVSIVAETATGFTTTPSVNEPIQPIEAQPVIEAQSEAEPSAKKDFATGDEVEANIDGVWKRAVIKRLNKKSIRVVLVEGKAEHTMQLDEVRHVTQELPLTVTDSEETPIEQSNVDCGAKSSDSVAEMVVENVPAVEEAPAVQEATFPAEPACSSAAMDVAAEQDCETEATQAEVSVPVVSTALTAPPTPIAAVTNSAGWNSCTRFSLQDSAVKNAEQVPKRKDRRNARRSAMKQLAETMKLETADPENEELPVPEAELPPIPVSAMVAAIEASICGAKAASPAPASASSAMLVEEVPEVPVCAPVEETVADVETIAPVIAAPTPFPAAPTPTTASVTAALSTTSITAVATKEVLPRMNKAQAMRIDAIQKKISTSESAPAPSTAFTINAKPAVPAQVTAPIRAAHTPSHYRSSICTSAPSSTLQSSMRHKQATPLAAAPSPAPHSAHSGRLSIQISGNKRKVSDSVERDRSSSANAPDFKRMHNKQFNTLKSIAECVDQDKTIGVRMTIAMESAMTTARPAAPVAPFKAHPTAEVAKPAANPFSKVVNKSATPGKPKQSGGTPAASVLSRPTTSGSSNILKSRTVMSFVPSGTKITSFVNNENSGPSSSNVTSFLKSKDSGSASMHKHRSVVVSGTGGAVNHGATKQRLQMF